MPKMEVFILKIHITIISTYNEFKKKFIKEILHKTIFAKKYLRHTKYPYYDPHKRKFSDKKYQKK